MHSSHFLLLCKYGFKMKMIKVVNADLYLKMSRIYLPVKKASEKAF